jgi:hypothetical protein
MKYFTDSYTALGENGVTERNLYMNKHKSDKFSQVLDKGHNKAGLHPQAPKVGGNQQNQYR